MPFRRLAAAILLLAAILFLVRLGSRGVVSEEVRWAEVAREMVLTGDYFWPTINGKPYYDKPLGSYWLVVAASKLTGGVDESAARLPAAVAGLVAVLAVMLLARRLYDGRTAVIAGAILATSYGFVFYCRRASADVETAAGVLIAFAIYARKPQRPGWGSIILLWVVMACTSQMKGLLGFALPGAYLIVDGLISRRRINPWLWNRWTFLAAPLGLAIFAAPYIATTLTHPSNDGLALLYRENLQRFFNPHNHRGPIYLYALWIFPILAPWSLFLIPALIHIHRQRSDSDRLVKVYFWTTFAFFTLAASRRSYYILPILPAAAILIARLFAAEDGELSSYVRRLKKAGIVLFAVALASLGLLLLPKAWFPKPYDELPPLPVKVAFAIGWIASMICGLFAYAKPNRNRVWRWMAATTFAGLIYLFAIALPELEALRGRREFAAEVRKIVEGEPGRLALYQSNEIAFDLRFNEPIREFGNEAELNVDRQVRYVIVARKSLPGSDVHYRSVLEEPGHPWERPEQAGLKLLLLELPPR